MAVKSAAVTVEKWAETKEGESVDCWEADWAAQSAVKSAVSMVERLAADLVGRSVAEKAAEKAALRVDEKGAHLAAKLEYLLVDS